MKFIALFALTIIFSLFTFSSYAADIEPYNGVLRSIENPNDYVVKVVNQGSEKIWSISGLESLPLVKADLKTRWELDGEFVGVRLSNLLAKSGIKTFKRLQIKAADGYQTVLGGGEDDLNQVIFATRLNGEVFTLSEKGPFFMVWPSFAQQVLKGEVAASKWVWSIVEIKKIR